MPELEEQFAQALEQMGLRPAMEAEEDQSEALVGLETVDPETPEEPAPPAPSSINLFNHPDAHPVVLGMALLKRYGPEWLLWEPEILYEAIPMDFRTSSVSSLARDKIQSIKTLHVNDLFWERWEVFNWCTQAFTDIYPDFEILQAPSAAQIMVSLDTASRIRSDVPWSSEVKEFIKQSCRFDGVFCPPAPLDQFEIGTEHGLVDCEEIARRWPQVRKSGEAPPEVTIVGEQLRRNLEAHKYLEANRARLAAQMEWVLNV
jgi:hypothetical protein